MSEGDCVCGHSASWEHYRRVPGNGQKYDSVCVGCLELVVQAPVPSEENIDPWHDAQNAQSGEVKRG